MGGPKLPTVQYYLSGNGLVSSLYGPSPVAIVQTGNNAVPLFLEEEKKYIHDQWENKTWNASSHSIFTVTCFAVPNQLCLVYLLDTRYKRNSNDSLAYPTTAGFFSGASTGGGQGRRVGHDQNRSDHWQKIISEKESAVTIPGAQSVITTLKPSSQHVYETETGGKLQPSGLFSSFRYMVHY